MTISNNYRLTQAGERLFNVLINPDNMGKSVSDVCEEADVSRNTYYRLHKEPEFIELVKETQFDLVKSKMGEVVNATYKYSLGEKGHQDRKMLMTMYGYYTDKSETKVEGVIDIGATSEILQRYLMDGEDSGAVSGEEPISEDEESLEETGEDVNGG